MRAQIALLESLICFAMLGSATAALFNFYSASPVPEPSAEYAAIASLESAYFYNSSMHACIESGAYSTFCNDTVKFVLSAYGLKGISIASGNKSTDFGELADCVYSKDYCIVEGNASDTSYLCQNICGG